MAISKYHSEHYDSDGERLWWPGGPNGFPFRGPVPPTVTNSEYENMQPTFKFRCRLFDLGKEEDLKNYQLIRDKCSNGMFFQLDKDRAWDDGIKNYRVYLEWVEPAYEIKPQIGVKDAIHAHKDQESVTVPLSRLSGLRSIGESW